MASRPRIVPHALQRLERVPFHGIVPVYVAVFAFVCGPRIHADDEAGPTFRWAALFALPALAAVWTFSRREPPAGLHSTVAGARNELLRPVHDGVSVLGHARAMVASLRRWRLSGAEVGLAVALILSSAGTLDQYLGLAGVIVYAAVAVVAAPLALRFGLRRLLEHVDERRALLLAAGTLALLGVPFVLIGSRAHQNLFWIVALFPAVVGLPEPGQHPPSWPRGSR